MSTYRTPIAVFGLRFQSLEDAQAFLQTSNVEYESDSIEDELLGLEYFEENDYYILGYAMTLGHTVDTYVKLWGTVFGETELVPQPLLDIRTY